MDTHSSNSVSNSDSNAQLTSTVKRVRNLVIVLVAIALSTAVFFGLRTETSVSSLEKLAESAVPLEVALENDKPTLMEFYANWCTSCQAMAKDMTELEEEYHDHVNFVMLNVDNTKWLPEMLKYRVDGIPMFVFLNSEGQMLANSIGEQPRLVMASNLTALANGTNLPYVRQQGRLSQVDAPTAPKASIDDPRSHGNPVSSES